MAKNIPDNWRGSNEYWEKLIKIYSAKFRLNPQSYIYLPLADALASVGRKEEAIETLEYGMALTPKRRASKILLAQLYYDTGNMQKARVILEKAVSLWPDTPAAVALLCRIYEKENNLYSAHMLSANLVNYYPDSGYVKSLAAKFARLAPAGRKRPAKAPRPLAVEILAESRDNEGKRASARPGNGTGKSLNGITGKARAAGAKRKTRKRKIKPDPREERLFALEHMLDKITSLKEKEKI